jgi:hypothetical protein
MDNWVLLVLVIVIIYFVSMHGGHMMSGALFGSEDGQRDGAEERSGDETTTSAALPDQGTTVGASVPVVPAETNETLTQRMLSEGIASANVTDGAQQCPSDLADANSYGADFSEWVARQTLDARIIESNRAFVADRMGNPQTWTGASFSPDRHESYDAVPWQGLSRPSRVPIASPDQIPDIDMTNNPAQQRVRWDSSTQ